jgi:hypothetical protein
MCNLYSIQTNQAAIIALFRVVNRYVGNLAPMSGVFPDYPAPVVRNTDNGTEMAMMRWGMPPPPRTGGPPVTNIRNTSSTAAFAFVAALSVVRSVAEGEELESNLLRVLHRKPAELGGLGKVARAAPAFPPGPKAAKRPFCPGGPCSQNSGWL